METGTFSRSQLLLAAMIVFAFPQCLLANSVDTMPYWRGSEITGFTMNHFAATSVGQTFRVTDINAFVTSITVPVFGYGASYGMMPTEFQIGVAAWNGSRPTGPMLYLSDMLVAPELQWRTFTVTPNNVSLVQNQEYVLLLTPINYWATDWPSESGAGYVPNSPYPDGKYVQFIGYSAGVSSLFSNDWSTIGNADIAFRVTYQPQSIPEPSTLVLAGFGVLSVLGWVQIKQRFIRVTH